MSSPPSSPEAASSGGNDEATPDRRQPPKIPEGGETPDLTGRTVVLVDAHSLIYQVFHAMPPMSSPSGQPVGAVYGFLGDLLELIARKSPDFLICAFDRSEVTFRNELYDQYKAHREPMPDDLRQQIPLIHEVVDAMGLAIMECAGYEADDIVATVAKQVDRAGGRCLIVTSDKDCRQLITDNVRMYQIRKDQEMSAEELMADWGIRPDQVVDYQAMVGDPVDNVPGIPLIGPKLAQQLLEQFGTLESVLDNADSVSGPKRRQNLLEGRERALLSRQLVRLKDDVPCRVPWKEAVVGRTDTDRLASLLDGFGFRRVKERAIAVLGGTPAEPEKVEWITNYRLIDSLEALDALVAQLSQCEEIAVDTETTSTNPRASELVGISLGWAPGEAVYIPVRAPAGEPQLDEAAVIERLRPMLENPNIGKIGQNLKFDIVVLRSAGSQLLGLRTDTMVADYLLDPGRRNHTLDELARRYLHHETTKIAELIGTGKKQKLMSEVPVAAVTDYAAEDVDVPIRIAPQLTENLREAELLALFESVEMPLVSVLAELEFNGIRVDVEKLAQMSAAFAEDIERLRNEIHDQVGHPFNVDSPRQLATVLFEELQLPVIKKTKTGASTDVDVLQQLAALHPVPAKVIAYRQATKLKSTYIDALPLLVNPKTGRLHTSFRQDVAATGRLSSSEPNLQNIPIRTEQGRAIRSAFRAGPDDWQLLGADYSQIELRMLAHYSEDEALIDAYASDADIHTRVAAEVHGVDEADVTAEMRRMAKTINFGIVYGQSPFGLAKTLGIPKDEAGAYIDLYFARYPGVQAFMLQTLAGCRKRGYVETMLGRRRPVQGVRDFETAGVARLRSLIEPERIAVNTVIQGSAADLIKLAMLRVHQRLGESRLPAKILLQIHDELLFEVADDAVDELAELVRTEMTGVVELKVPLKVDIASGKSWADV